MRLPLLGSSPELTPSLHSTQPRQLTPSHSPLNFLNTYEYRTRQFPTISPSYSKESFISHHQLLRIAWGDGRHTLSPCNSDKLSSFNIWLHNTANTFDVSESDSSLKKNTKTVVGKTKLSMAPSRQARQVPWPRCIGPSRR
jgi:hypothetical protein